MFNQCSPVCLCMQMYLFFFSYMISVKSASLPHILLLSASSQEAAFCCFTVMDYELNSFIGGLLSCKITVGTFFLFGKQFIGGIYSRMTFSAFPFCRHIALSVCTVQSDCCCSTYSFTIDFHFSVFKYLFSF